MLSTKRDRIKQKDEGRERASKDEPDGRWDVEKKKKGNPKSRNSVECSVVLGTEQPPHMAWDTTLQLALTSHSLKSR